MNIKYLLSIMAFIILYILTINYIIESNTCKKQSDFCY